MIAPETLVDEDEHEENRQVALSQRSRDPIIPSDLRDRRRVSGQPPAAKQRVPPYKTCLKHMYHCLKGGHGLQIEEISIDGDEQRPAQDEHEDDGDVCLPFELSFGCDCPKLQGALLQWASNICKSTTEMWEIVQSLAPSEGSAMPAIQGDVEEVGKILAIRVTKQSFENESLHRLQRNR